MRLGIDLRCLAEGEQGGIAAYTHALLPRLAEAFSGSCVGLVTGRNVHVPDMPCATQHVRWPNKVLNAFLVTCKRPRLDRYVHADIFFAPTPKYLSVSSGVPFVLTVHDLSFLDHPEYFTRRQRFWHHWLRMGQLIARATRIIAVSEHTAQDIRRFVPEAAERIRVIHSGADHGPTTVATSYAGLPPRYALAFAPAEPRKNIENLLLAQAQAYPRTKLPLVLVGAGAASQEGVVSLPRLSAEDRWRVLGGAEIFVYPSLYEGFGFPPLEAMRMGVPVIASHVTSLPEVLDDAALYVDPWDPQDIARGLETLASDGTVRAVLQARGKQQADKYHWDACAAATVSVINEAYAHWH